MILSFGAFNAMEWWEKNKQKKIRAMYVKQSQRKRKIKNRMFVIMWLQIEFNFDASSFTFFCWCWEILKFYFSNLHRKRQNQRANERASERVRGSIGWFAIFINITRLLLFIDKRVKCLIYKNISPRAHMQTHWSGVSPDKIML